MKKNHEEVNKDYILNSLDNALSLLDCFNNQEYTVPELAEKLDLNKSSVYRMVYTLWNRNYLKKNEKNYKYSIGLKLFVLGTMYRKNSDIINSIHPYLKKLVENIGETACLVMLIDNKSTIMDRIEGTKAMQINDPVGTRLPAYCTAAGRVLLSGLDEESFQKYVKNISFEKLTPNTITDPQKFIKEIQKVKEQGYSINNEESEIGLIALSTPIKNQEGKIIAAINITGPTSRMKKEQENCLEQLKSISQKINQP